MSAIAMLVGIPLAAGTLSVTLTALAQAGVLPTITHQPQSQAADVYANAAFTVEADGTPPLSYQWRSNGVDLVDAFDGGTPRISGAHSATLTLWHVVPDFTGRYSVVVSGAGGSITSTVATLVVGSMPHSIFDNYNTGGVGSGPTVPTTFSIASPYWISVIRNYHFYNGGALPGKISLLNADGTLYGPWQAVAGEAVWGVTNSIWLVTPHTVIKPGSYTVLDSGNSTWSCNSGGGFSAVYGFLTNEPPMPPQAATATATVVNDFVVGATVTDGGWGYTNTPSVRIIGGGGSGAEAVAVVNDGVVVAINLLDAGFGYTNTPVLVIAPPFIPQPTISIAATSLLSFTNLAVGTNYQLQFSDHGTWADIGTTFNASSSRFTKPVLGTANPNQYRLAVTPVASQAYATVQVVNGFVVGITVISGGSGYVANPAVTILSAGSGSNATATATVNAGVVTSITVTSAGAGYTTNPTISIAPPPSTALWPSVTQVMQLDLQSLSPYDNYQLEYATLAGGAWTNIGNLFTPTASASTQFVNAVGDSGFLRVRYVP